MTEEKVEHGLNWVAWFTEVGGGLSDYFVDEVTPEINHKAEALAPGRWDVVAMIKWAEEANATAQIGMENLTPIYPSDIPEPPHVPKERTLRKLKKKARKDTEAGQAIGLLYALGAYARRHYNWLKSR